MNQKQFCTIVAGVLSLSLFSGPVMALHLTSITVNPSNIYALPGETVQYSGTVGAATTCSSFTAYSTTLSVAGEPAGAVTTFTPPGTNVDEETSYNYTLDIEVPGDAIPGLYPLQVTAHFWIDPCENGDRSDFTTLTVLAGNCPSGGSWDIQPALGPNDVYDMNGDGFICTKILPGSGEGNSANRNGAADAGHVDGHNHKDNNN